jgi:DNA-binding transcriptional LysR family regulator
LSRTRAGVPPEVYGPALRGGTRFPDSAAALQAALDGEGIALIRSATAWDDLASGRIVRLLDVRCPFHRAVYLVSRKRSISPAWIAFRDWLMEESERAQAEFDAAEMGDAKG